MSPNPRKSKVRESEKAKPDYRANKQAFDQVLHRVRQNGEVTVGPVKAVKPDGSSGKPAAINPAIPNMVEFLCDVIIAVKRVLPRDISFERFRQVYMFPRTDDYLEQEKFAQKVLRDRRHSAEQRIGAEFIRVSIFPLTKYMKYPRRPRPKHAV